MCGLASTDSVALLAENHNIPFCLSGVERVAFFLYLGQFYPPVRALSGAWERIQEALPGAERVVDLLAEAPDVVVRADGCGENGAGASSQRLLLRARG